MQPSGPQHRAANVRFTPKSGHSANMNRRAANDPKRTFQHIDKILHMADIGANCNAGKQMRQQHGYAGYTQFQARKNILTAFRRIAVLTFCLLMLTAITLVDAEAPVLDPAEDANHLGEVNNLLFWTPEQQVAGYRNIDRVYPTRIISAGGSAYELPEQLVDLNDVQISFEDKVLTTDDYFSQQNVAGLLVIKNGRIVYERYGLGNSQDSLWVSFSVAKSVTSLLVGAAIRDGYIKSVDEKVTDYLPRLKESSYKQATIRNILQMSSGVQWD